MWATRRAQGGCLIRWPSAGVHVLVRLEMRPACGGALTSRHTDYSLLFTGAPLPPLESTTRPHIQAHQPSPWPRYARLPRLEMRPACGGSLISRHTNPYLGGRRPVDAAQRHAARASRPRRRCAFGLPGNGLLPLCPLISRHANPSYPLPGKDRWPAWKCVCYEEGPSHPGTHTHTHPRAAT